MSVRLVPVGEPFDGLEKFLYEINNPTRREQAQIGRSVRREFARIFSDQGGTVRWAPLAPSTVSDRVRKGFPGRRPILIRTGGYMRSWVQAGDSDHIEDFERTVNGWNLKVGSRDYRAIWHEFGTARMPARPVANLPAGAEDRIARTIDDVFARLWERG